MIKHDQNGKFAALYDKPMRRVEFQAPPEEIKQIDELAKKMGITRSNLIRKGIEIILQEVHV